MGGCATKPKVLKGDDSRDDVAPAPSNSPPAPLQKEEVVDTVVKEAVVDNDAKEGVPVAVDHDSATKNSSLGNLFKENQDGKDSDEKEKETVKVADVSETTNSPKEVEKTIHEDSDSSLKKNKSAAEEKKTEEEKVEVEEFMGEIAEKKKPDEVMVNVVTPEEQNLDHIKPRITDPEEKLEIPQKQEVEEKKKETEESMKENPSLPPPTTAAVDQEKFSTPKEKPVENNAIPKVVKGEVEEEEEEEEEEKKKKKAEENNAIPKVVEMEVEEDKKKKPEEMKQKTLN